jgi:hypothetical protein
MKDARTLELNLEMARIMGMYRRDDELLTKAQRREDELKRIASRRFLQEPELPSGFAPPPFAETEPFVRIVEAK